jgi:4-aminobutyrate aminotransferase-like enzyme
MQGTELVLDRDSKEPAPQLANAMLNVTRKIGLLIGKGGMDGNTLRIAPPLSTTKEHIEEALEKLDYAFAQVQETVA